MPVDNDYLGDHPIGKPKSEGKFSVDWASCQRTIVRYGGEHDLDEHTLTRGVSPSVVWRFAKHAQRMANLKGN